MPIKDPFRTLTSILQDTDLESCVEEYRDKIRSHPNIWDLVKTLRLLKKTHLLKGNFARINFRLAIESHEAFIPFVLEILFKAGLLNIDIAQKNYSYLMDQRENSEIIILMPIYLKDASVTSIHAQRAFEALIKYSSILFPIKEIWSNTALLNARHITTIINLCIKNKLSPPTAQQQISAFLLNEMQALSVPRRTPTLSQELATVPIAHQDTVPPATSSSSLEEHSLEIFITPYKEVLLHGILSGEDIIKLIHTLNQYPTTSDTLRYRVQVLQLLSRFYERSFSLDDSGETLVFELINRITHSSLPAIEIKYDALLTLLKLCQSDKLPVLKITENIHALVRTFASKPFCFNTHSILKNLAKLCQYNLPIQEIVGDIYHLASQFSQKRTTRTSEKAIVLWALAVFSTTSPEVLESYIEIAKDLLKQILSAPIDQLSETICGEITTCAGVLLKIDDDNSCEEFKQLSLIREKARPTHSKVDLLDSERGWRSEYCLRGYFVDYYNILTKTILEFDGPSHLKSDKKVFDDFRDIYLKSLGYTIIRVTNLEKLRFFLNTKGAEVHETKAERTTSLSLFSQAWHPRPEQAVSQVLFLP